MKENFRGLKRKVDIFIGTKNIFNPKKMSQLLRCNYCLKNFSTPYLIVVFLILVDVFNVS